MAADAPTFDLQSHSTHSDGTLPAAEVVAGVPEALAAAEAHGIRLSPAAELSSVHGAHEDLHILGYGIDPSDPGLQAALEDFRADRGRRIHAMADRLRDDLGGRERAVGTRRMRLQIEVRGVSGH